MNSNEAYKTIWAKCLRVIKDNIMALDVTGRLVQVLELQSGTSARGEWKRQEFIIETEEQYPRKICISLWNEEISEIAGIAPGEGITVSIILESREFQGHWYTEARAWRVERTLIVKNREEIEERWVSIVKDREEIEKRLKELAKKELAKKEFAKKKYEFDTDDEFEFGASCYLPF